MNTVRDKINERGRVLRKLNQDVGLIDEAFGLRDVLEEWAPTVDTQTADDARNHVRRFIEFHQDYPLEDLKKSHLREFSQALQGIPTITTAKLPDGGFVRDLHFNKLIKWATKYEKETLSDKTRSKYIGSLKTLMSFAVQQDYRDVDPWRDYKIPKVKKKFAEGKKNDRRPFTADELKQISDTVWTTGTPQYGPATIDRWGPTFSIYHGTRIQEVCQLRIKDFADRDGIWCVEITDDGEEMSVKSEASVRWVPVHPKLVAMGLKQQVALRAVEASKEERVFLQADRWTGELEALRPDSRGRVSGNYGKRFAHLRCEKLKITGQKVSFHSFRHRLQDAADTAGIPEAHRRYLTGRANKDATEGGYGEGASMKALLGSLNMVDPMKD